MKKILTAVIMMTYFTSLGALASETPVPTLISEDGEPEVTIMDGGISTIMVGEDRNLAFDGCVVKDGETELEYDVAPIVKDGTLYLPLRYTVEALGYEVKWNNDTRSIEILNGSKYTSITLDKNSYYKNRMAAQELSGAPFALNGRTLVPIEFFALILDESFNIVDNEIVFNHDMYAVHSGYVQSISHDETGTATITISSLETSLDIMDQTLIHTNSYFSVFQKNVEEGMYINVITAPVMTMSIPGQTGGFVIY